MERYILPAAFFKSMTATLTKWCRLQEVVNKILQKQVWYPVHLKKWK